MTATLTVAIPTYNRSDLLSAQLDRLAPDLARFGERCRVLISDNCSSDDTPRVVAAWCADHPELRVTYRRNEGNIGVMRNLAACARAADGEFVWLLGDDDELPAGTLGHLLTLLDAHPTVTLLSVNYSMFDVARGVEMTPARMRLSADVHKSDVGPLVTSDQAGVPLVKMMGFMSGQVYRTAVLRRAIDAWPAFDNLDLQIFWSGYCAAAGPTLVVAEPLLRYDCGTNALAKPDIWYSTHVVDNARVFLELRRIGYPIRLCRRGIASVIDSPSELKHTLWGIVRWPRHGLRAMVLLPFALVAVHLMSASEPQG